MNMSLGEVVATCGFDGTLKLWDGRLGVYVKDITKRDVQVCLCVRERESERTSGKRECVRVVCVCLCVS